MYPMTVTINSDEEMRTTGAKLLALAQVAEAQPVPNEAAPAKKSKAAPAHSKATPAPSVESPDSTAQPAVAEESTSEDIKFEDVRKAFLDLAKRDRDAAVRVLDEVGGYTKLSEVPPEEFGLVLELIAKA